MSFTGYRVYRGLGGLGAVDWATSVAAAAPGATSVQLVDLRHTAGATYTYALRPVLADLETADVSCVTSVSFDGSGDWTGDRPRAVCALSARVEAAGAVGLQWRPAHDGTEPDDYAIYTGSSANVDTSGAPVKTVAADDSNGYAATLTCADGETIYVAVVARTSGGAASPAATLGPIVADAASPSAPAAYADAAI